VFKQSNFGAKGVLEGHWETGLTQGPAVFIKLSLPAASGQRDSGKAVMVFGVEVCIDVVSIECSIKGAEVGAKAESAFHVGHQGVEVSDIRLVEGQGEFSQDEFAPSGNFGGHNAGSVAPEILVIGREIGRAPGFPGG